MKPSRLVPGDEIRVVAPSSSLAIVSEENRKRAEARLRGLGFRLSYSRHSLEKDELGSPPAKMRTTDLEEAFRDSGVKAILSAIGGYICNRVLDLIDWNVIRNHPKTFCGFSDITVLLNAIWAKTGLITYHGPHFSTFAMEKGLEYTVDHFLRCVSQEIPFEVKPAETWSDDPWYRDQENRTFHRSAGWTAMTEGEEEGTVLGGNLSTFLLLAGTEYMPDLSGSILFLEDDEEVTPRHFDRYLQALLHQPGFSGVRGLVIGRFQKASGMSDELLSAILRSHPELRRIPVAAGVDFGHTTPQFTFPVGGTARLTVRNDKIRLEIVEH